MESEDSEPELVVSLKHQHNLIALFDTEGLKVIRSLAGGFLNILKGKYTLGLILGNVNHSYLIGAFSR